jgi:hypothetical protein
VFFLHGKRCPLTRIMHHTAHFCTFARRTRADGRSWQDSV